MLLLLINIPDMCYSFCSNIYFQLTHKIYKEKKINKNENKEIMTNTIPNYAVLSPPKSPKLR
jgi:hypothetical protein